MLKYVSRIWSIITFAIVLLLAASVGFVQSAPTGRPAEQPDEPLAGRAQRQGGLQISPELSAIKRSQPESPVEPSDDALFRAAVYRAGPNATPAQLHTAAEQFLHDWRETSFHGPDPVAQQRLLHNEQRALAANSSPAAMGLAVTGTLRLLTIAVEFNGTDTANNYSHPVSVFGSRECITETVTFEGPLHNQIPAPGPRDNNTFWRPQFEKSHYEQLMFSTTGITERVRLDLDDPEDGQPGINIAGSTMYNYYDEVSGGRVELDSGPSGVMAWVQVPHSEGYYSADACIDGDPGRIQDNQGLPQNPRFPSGVGQLLVDVVDEINANDPNFPWESYDTDGNGVLDHVVIIHAGEGKSGGGGLQGYQAIWAHRGNVGAGGYTVDDRGTPSTDDDIKVDGYLIQPENAGVGVLAHEFGHDLGLPDLYDTTSGGESSVVWWDLMSTGSHPGKLFQAMPTHMSAWSKFALGWADITPIEPELTKRNVTLGQTSGPPVGTEQAVRVNLPNTVLTNTELLTGSLQAWWTGNDQNWADVRLTRDVDLTGSTGPISLTFDIDGAAELDWDYMFVEVSVDGGTTYTQTKGFEVGSDIELTTPDDYPDPNGRLADYGGLVHGYTGDLSEIADNTIPVGDHGHWVHAYHDLSAYAGQSIKLRFRYATDAAFLERGYFIDNIMIGAASGVVLDDPVEGDNANGWTTEVRTFAVDEPLGAGWRMTDGVEELPLYYILEWRNAHGFDRGLLYTYQTIYSTDPTPTTAGEWRVDRVASNVPGMIVWLRDTRYGNEPFNANNSILDDKFIDMPSEGPKGGLLVIDSHPMPLRGPLGGEFDAGFGAVPFPPLNNWSGRVQTTNSAFGLQNTPSLRLSVTNAATTIFTPTTYAPLPPVSLFDDGLGYFPGVEELPEPVKTFSSTTVLRLKPYAFSDPDASAVVPAKKYYPPSTPPGFTGHGAETSPPSSSVSTFETLVWPSSGTTLVSIGEAGDMDIEGQQSGNPRDYHAQYGYHFRVAGQTTDASSGIIEVWIGMPVYLPIIHR